MSHTALITGAAGGLGLQTAMELARRDHAVVLVDREVAATAAAVEAVRREVDGAAVDGRACDLGDAADLEALIAWLGEAHPNVDVVVNNAAVILAPRDPSRPEDAGVQRVSREQVLAAFQINALAPYRLNQALLPGMNERGYGRIVQVSSGMGSLARMTKGWPEYRMSKAALNAATRLFADEAGPGVKVNSVCPGWVRTGLGGDGATRTVEEGARGIVWAATLPGDGPSGGFFRDGEPIAW